jgi:hypothetical protein
MATSIQWFALRYVQALHDHGAASVEAYNAYQRLLDAQRR